jgi:hypothetical protein
MKTVPKTTLFETKNVMQFIFHCKALTFIKSAEIKTILDWYNESL